MINSIQGINGSLPKVNPFEQKDGTVRTSFKDTLTSFVRGVNSDLREADKKVGEFAVGETQDIHDIMVTSEKAGVSFKLLMEIRNSLVEAYKEIMRMQF